MLTKFAAWVGDAPVVAHNVGFDLPFVLRHMPHDAAWQPSAVYDTLELAYQLYPDAGSYKLADLVRFVFGRDHGAAHRAMPDAEATAELFIDLTNGLRGAARGDPRPTSPPRSGAARPTTTAPSRAIGWRTSGASTASARR